MTRPSLRNRLGSHRHYPWLVVGLLWFCGFFNYADRQAVISVFPLLEDRVQTSSNDQIGLAGLGVHARLRADVAVHRLRGRSVLTPALDSARAGVLEPDLRGDGVLEKFRPARLSSARPRGWASRSTSRRRCRSWPTIIGRGRARARSSIHQTSVYLGTAGGRCSAASSASGTAGDRRSWCWAWREWSMRCSSVVSLIEPVRGVGARRESQAEPRDDAASSSPTTADPTAGQEGRTHRCATRPPPCFSCVFVGANFVAATFLTWLPMFIFREVRPGARQLVVHVDLLAAGQSARGALRRSRWPTGPPGGRKGAGSGCRASG